MATYRPADAAHSVLLSHASIVVECGQVDSSGVVEGLHSARHSGEVLEAATRRYRERNKINGLNCAQKCHTAEQLTSVPCGTVNLRCLDVPGSLGTTSPVERHGVAVVLDLKVN